MRNKVIQAIEKEKLIVIVRGVEKEKLIPLAEAMYQGGIRLLEVTYSANGAVSDEETSENIKMLAIHFEGRMYVGAGTVLSERQVELTRAAGGCFIISPDAYAPVIEKTRKLGMVSIPGALTPSEATAAHRAGADFVKLFPISQSGPGYVKALCAPLSHIRFLAVGGVNGGNMMDYMSHGAKGVGMGLSEADKQAILAGNFDAIEAKCREMVEKLK